MPRVWLNTIILGLLMLNMSACGALATPTPTPEMVIQQTIDISGVVAEGRLYPTHYVALSFNRKGEVLEIRVKEGQSVKKGDVIARLKDDQAAYADLAIANQNLLDAQQAMEDIIKNAGVDNAKALQSLTDATEKLRQAKHSQYNYTVPTRLTIYSMFEAADKTLAGLTQARKAYEPYIDILRDSTGLSDLPPTLCIPASLCKGLAIQSKDTPARVLRDELNDAEGDFLIAINQIKQAAAVSLSTAQLDKAQLDVQKLNNQPDPDKLAAAALKVKSTELSVKASQKAVDDLSLFAPFDGAILKLDLKVGELATSAVQFANRAQWVVETNNLTEIQVVKVQVGQPVLVRVDAIPDESFKGVVRSVRDMYEEKQGDVTYMVKIDLTENSPDFRWGMTVVTTFKALEE